MERKNVSVVEMIKWVDGSFLTSFTVSSGNLCVANEGVAIRVQTSPPMKQLMLFWVLFAELSEQRFWGRCGGCCRVWWPTVCRCKNLWQSTRLKASCSLSSPHHYFPLEEILYSLSAWDLVNNHNGQWDAWCIQVCDTLLLWESWKMWQVKGWKVLAGVLLLSHSGSRAWRILHHSPLVVVHRSWKMQVGGVFH